MKFVVGDRVRIKASTTDEHLMRFHIRDDYLVLRQQEFRIIDSFEALSGKMRYYLPCSTGGLYSEEHPQTHGWWFNEDMLERAGRVEGSRL